MLASAAMNNDLIGVYKSPVDEHREAFDAEGYGARAESSAIRSAAVEQKNDANASGQSTVTSDVEAFELACHLLGIGADDSG